ncbi:hypothetical protein PT974_08149 [Cladobotryum mycophilum]|uniref:Uncharacterized protein n=1 Tax=Cladobotryum mycophilum TaxID=491253 RepID=A0ABR0SCJ3_9HYPO
MDTFLDTYDAGDSYLSSQWLAQMKIDGLPSDDLFTDAYLPCDEEEEQKVSPGAEMTRVQTDEAGAEISSVHQDATLHGAQTLTQGMNHEQVEDPLTGFDWSNFDFDATTAAQTNTNPHPFPNQDFNQNRNTKLRRTPWAVNHVTRNPNYSGFHTGHTNLTGLPTKQPHLSNHSVGSNMMARAGAILKNVQPSNSMQEISHHRAERQSQDPSSRYRAEATAPNPWGSLAYNDQHLFSYTAQGQWLLDRCFDASQLREYVTQCPKGTIFWLQQAPTHSTHRLDPEDRLCRWVDCPVANRKITAGWLRVAFDESPALTSDGTKDPLKVAGSMHLWCFEQVFDPLEFHMSGKLRPEHRKFPNEDKSVVTLEKLTDAGIIRESYLPWIEEKTKEWRISGPLSVPRPHNETLSYALNKYHLDNQTAARQKARVRRNEHKTQEEKRTIDVHMGDLGLYVEACKKAKDTKKWRRLSEARNGRSIQDLYPPHIPGQPRLRMLPSRHSLSRIPQHGNSMNSIQLAQEYLNPLALITPPRLAHGSALSTAPSPALLQTRTSGNGRDPRSSNAGVNQRAVTSGTPLLRQWHPMQKQVHQTPGPSWDSRMPQSKGIKRPIMHIDPLDSPREQGESRAKRQRTSYRSQSSYPSIGEGHTRASRGSSGTSGHAPPSKGAHDTASSSTQPLDAVQPQENLALSRSEPQDSVRQSHIDVRAQGNPATISDMLDQDSFQAQLEELQEPNADTSNTTPGKQNEQDFNSWQPGGGDDDDGSTTQMSSGFEGIWDPADHFIVDGLDLTDLFRADDLQDEDAFNFIPAGTGDADDVNRTDQTHNGVTSDGPSSNPA